jgi:hypothetical protein
MGPHRKPSIEKEPIETSSSPVREGLNRSPFEKPWYTEKELIQMALDINELHRRNRRDGGVISDD